MKCESWYDLHNLILDNEIRPLKGRISSEEFQKRWSAASERAKKLWERLIKNNQRYFDSDGFINVEFFKGKYRRVPMHRGRPEKGNDEKKDNRITIRLDDDLTERLNKYCQTNNIKPSEAAREALKRYL